MTLTVFCVLFLFPNPFCLLNFLSPTSCNLLPHRLNGRFLRLDVLDVWFGVYEKSQAVIKEVEFFGEVLVTSLANGEERLCAWPTVFDEELDRCAYLDGGGG